MRVNILNNSDLHVSINNLKCNLIVGVTSTLTVCSSVFYGCGMEFHIFFARSSVVLHLLIQNWEK